MRSRTGLLQSENKEQTMMTKPPLIIRIHLTDGSAHSFVTTDHAAARKLWDAIEPARLFATHRLVIGSEHSKAVFVSSEIVRIDLINI